MAEARFRDLQVVEINGRDVMTWRLFEANRGDTWPGHRHTIHHLTQLVSGAMSVRVGEVAKHYVAPATILIDKDVEHSMLATEDGTSWCCTFLIPEGGDARTLSLEA